jgi:hypothetical protein
MQSDEDNFGDTVETLTPERKTQDPTARFSLRLTPSRVESEKRKMDRRKNLFESLTPRSEDTSGGATFSYRNASSFNFETAEPTPILKKDYTPKEKADIIQEMEIKEAKAEKEFPNALFDICGADNVEEEQMIDILFARGKTTADENHIENCIKVNELKKKRANIYASITRGEKTLMRLLQKADPGDWEIFEQKTKESFDALTRIMDNLQMIRFDRKPVEDTKYLNYTSRLKKLIAKIDHIMATFQAKIPGMVETLLDQYVQEENDFCGSFNNPWTDNQDLQRQQDEDDKRRKDAADQQAKMADFKARLSMYKTSANASGATGLTKRPASSRTYGASAQAGSQQGAYTQAGAQLGSQPPPQFPNPPPPLPQQGQPPQQNFPRQQYGTQAAAGYPMRPQANYQGIPKLKVPTFDGEPSEFQRFKLTFHAAYDDRNLPQKHLALLLESVLKGRPLTIISEYMRTCIDDLSYARMWELLEERFGGKNVEDAFTINMFKNAPQIKNGSLKEVERLYDVFSVQHAYYLTNDPESPQEGTFIAVSVRKRETQH